ncbi:phosphodiester glycosidase family protein [Paenibacillus sp. PL91]|uniref:phosphodiester glycosidase family protein n=1 Tax=Paenibacillus sp. PL91 TaxID=2729538 RepID=UPI00145C4176|nr:phosphodiester glycosidase family protein [Paenibacillus sp. PL91]MBC9204040.1 phosphodiester glycosidase family protein [Paenibacillus sp. PL91]
MKKYLRKTNAFIIFALLISLLQPALIVNAAITELPTTEYGKVIDIRQTELAPGAVYTWMDMENERGLQKIHTVAFDPKNPNLELRAGTKDGKVYGMKGVTEMAAHADAPGSRVIAGINGDFYEISGFATGVPNGLFMDEGRILNSSISSYAFGLKADGSSIYGAPKLTKTVTIGGVTTNLTSINRYRDTNQLVLYTADYNTTTKSTNLGDEVVLDIIEGDVKSGQTMKLKVAELRKDQGDTAITQGQVVLSASGTSRAVVAGLQVGDEMAASFALDGEWAQVSVAIGGQGPLVKDGVPQLNVGPAGVHPRTAIGTKADGSIVLFEIDGRAPGFSEGVETDELAKMLKDIGVVNGMNLDGGGSSTFAAKLPGTSKVQMLNQGSDGGERKTGNGLLLINKAPELNAASKLAVQPNAERILKGASFTFKAAGIDANGHPAAYSDTLAWQVDPSLGTVDASGVFTAGTAFATGFVTAAAGAVQGKGEIEVVDQLTALKFPDIIKTYNSGATASLSVKALRNGQTVQANNRNFEWRVEGNIGTVDENGVFQATTENGQQGKIFVKYGNVETSFEVNVGLPPVLLEDFESGLDKYIASSAAANYSRIVEVTDQDYVRSGNKALKLEYDFIGKTGTSGAYLAASSTQNRIQIPGYPEKLSMWVYGDGKKHWLRAQLRDGNNAAIPVDFTDNVSGVNWTGWKYVEVAVPKGKATPLTIDMPIRYMETSNVKKTDGALYIDDIRALYGPLEEDTTPPVFKDIYPAENAVIKTATPTIAVHGEDTGYDPVQHPGTTLIDPAKTRVYVDDQLVGHGFHPPAGLITYKSTIPLSEGRHKVKVAIRDMAGNQTIKEWYFMVNLGSPYYVYDTPSEVYAGTTNTLNIHAEKASKLKEGHIAFKFDPAAIKDLQVIRGSKVQEGQLEPVIDEAQGLVRLNLFNINEASLVDADILGQIQYTVRNDYIGPLTLEQTEVEVTKPLVIENTSGSVLSTEGTGTPISFVGAAAQATVKTQLKLSWDHFAIGMGYAASFKVAEVQGGAAVEGSKLLINQVEVADTSSSANGMLTTTAATQAVGTYNVQAVKGSAYSPVMTFKVAPYAGTAAPRNMNVTMGADPNTSRHFTWQTDPLTTDTVVELVKQSDFTSFEDNNIIEIAGTSSIYNTNNDGTMRVHKAEADQLTPDTIYVYRVGDGKTNVSSEGTFRTSAAAGDTMKFLFIGDSQADSKAGFALWGNTLEEASAYMPDAEMLVHAGDIVDKGYEQEQWDWWFEAAQDKLMNTTLVPIIGNHEVMGTNGAGDYLAQFHNPQNGAASVKGSNFSFDVKDTHFVVMNTEMSSQIFDEQAQWLDEDLGKSDKKWKVIFFHQGPYGSIYANEKVQSTWVPIFDKHGVDLVMNGHDHIYMRSHPMKGGEKVAEGQGTRYVIGGSSGPKFYALTEHYWQEKIFDEDAQIFTAVDITKDEIVVVGRTVDGREIDRFAIAKVEPETVTLDHTSAELEAGQPITLKATVLPDHATEKELVWSVVQSTPENAVTVNAEGMVTAMKPGQATVRATVSGYPDIFAESEITVTDMLQGVTLQGKTALQIGAADQTVAEAVYGSGRKKVILSELAFASSNEEVAAINEAGLVSAKKEGTAEISVTFKGFNAKYEVTVTANEPEVTLSKVELSGLNAQMNPGQSANAKVTAVYSDGSSRDVSGEAEFKSSSPNTVEIVGGSTVKALQAGLATITASYGGKQTEFVINVTEPATPTPPPVTTPTPVPTPTPTPTPSPEVPGVVKITDKQLTDKNADGEVVIETNGQLKELVLPGHTAQLLAGAPFKVDAQNLAISIPAQVLEDLTKLLPADQVSKSTISLTAKAASSNESSAILVNVGSQAGAQLRMGSAELLDFSLTMTTEAGVTVTVTKFDQPITISFAVDPLADASLLGIYYIADDGKLQYIGGKLVNGRLTAAVNHFSKYAVLEYNKSFIDLPQSHWAAKAVKELAAKQLIQGVSTERFNPSEAITRAEFAAMLVRVLGITGQATPMFTDVPVAKWYANEVALSQQAGIVKGVSATTFAPNASVTRQEMAVMIVRAYDYAVKKQSEFALSNVRFTDTAAAPDWARTAILTAIELGLMYGRTNEIFAPIANGSRAESAQMILNLINRINE